VAEVVTDRPVPVAAPAEPRQTIRFARAADGTRLAYAVTGAGPPVIHTGHFPTNLELDWPEPSERAMYDVLSAGNTLVRYDQRGCGLSDHALTEIDFDVLADDLLRVADAAGLDRFTVFGRSGGSLIAQYVAAKHPERVSRLMLLGGYVDGRSRRGTDMAEDQEAITSMMREGWNTPGSGFVTAYLTAYFPDAPADFVHRYAEIVQASCPVENVLIHRKAINRVATAGLLERISAPTLVMHARHDAVHPLSEGRKLATGIANAELVVFDTANHYPVPGTPVWAEFTSVLRGFLDR
jgi:pimeloyl-ACP methyl ester carboxylesterase